MNEQVIVLSVADRALLGALRCMPHLMVGQQGELLWLRGIPVAADSEGIFMKLPALERYQLGGDNLLFLPGAMTPLAYLPSLPWKPIAEFIVPEMPLAAYGGILAETISIELVSGEKMEDERALICTLDHLQAWVEDAAEVRIQALHIAVAAGGDVLVIGDPLPTLPGQALWDCNGLWLPAGRQLKYGMLASTIRKQRDPEETHFIILHADGGWERIPKSNFVQATRSGIRQTTATVPT